MKFSFIVPPKSSSRLNSRPSENQFNQEDTSNDGQTEHEYITEFDSSKTQTDKQSKHLVIPPLENTWRPHRKMKNLDLHLRSSSDNPDLSFELEAPNAAGDTDPNVSYGLNLRIKENGGSTDVDKELDVDEELPVNSNSIKNVMLQKFKEDMQNLPDGEEFDGFVDVPVEGFGAALLAGYGWSEGKGIGRNAKEDVKVVQYEGWVGRKGLGF